MSERDPRLLDALLKLSDKQIKRIAEWLENKEKSSVLLVVAGPNRCEAVKVVFDNPQDAQDFGALANKARNVEAVAVD